jgi:hypothetical protein
VGYFYKNQDLFTLPELLSSPPVAHHISFLCNAALRFLLKARLMLTSKVLDMDNLQMNKC